MLLAALLLAAVAFGRALGGGWFYDDGDYVLNDPRLAHPELFLPGTWSNPPPPLPSYNGQDSYLPGYGEPLIGDRFLWRASFMLEWLVLGVPVPWVSHAVNLALHLGCVSTLYFALGALQRLYLFPIKVRDDSPAALLPGVAAVLFAVHPWAVEPVCYVSARNGSMGALFALLGLRGWTLALDVGARVWARCAGLAAAGLCAFCAFASKENFITVTAGYLLATLPVWLGRCWGRSKGLTLGVGGGAVALMAGIGWLGIRFSERARGLFEQTVGGRGWTYLFEIQSPLLLMTLADQFIGWRFALETGHPGWPAWACVIALLVNVLLFAGSTVAGFRWPVLLGIAWFYLHLMPTNSFLPRPDFLAPRNVYLPAMGVCVALAGGIVALAPRLAGLLSEKPDRYDRRARGMVLALAAVPAWFGCMACVQWSLAYQRPALNAWTWTVRRAPEHGPALQNHAAALMSTAMQRDPPDPELIRQARSQLDAMLRAESSSTMVWHVNERPRAVRRASALLNLAQIADTENNLPDAARCYEESFKAQQWHSNWIGWATTVFHAGPRFEEQLIGILKIGEKTWPGNWRVAAVRGINKARNAGSYSFSEDTMADLEKSVDPTDVQTDFDQRLQARTIAVLLQGEGSRGRAQELFARLMKLGYPAQDLELIYKQLQQRGIRVDVPAIRKALVTGS